MRYVLPAVLFTLFAALVVISPHLEPRRLRARAEFVNGQLRGQHGFVTGSHASWSEVHSTGWPPFHYGKRQHIDGELVGEVDGLTVRTAGYECVFAGDRHRYGLVCILLPATIEWAEARGEPAFSAARVPDHVPDGHQSGATPEFDAVYQIYTEASDIAAVLARPRTAQTLLELPERFSFRTLNDSVLLWKRGGWPSAESLIESVRAVQQILSPVLTLAWPA
jgi:hypothetical protein